MIAGYPFKYDNIMSSRYHMIIANIKTSSNEAEINGSMEYTTLNLPVNNKVMLLGKALKEAYSFDMEVVSEKSNVALSLKQQKSIVNWLFEREYHKLEIISEEYKDIYFNCYLTQPKKIVEGCGVIGYSCKVVTDGLGAWENTKTKSFYQHQVSSYSNTDINFSMPYSGKMDISVDGNTTEVLNGIKTSTNQSTLKGVSKVIDSTDGLSQEFPIGQDLNRIDSITYDTANMKTGQITLNTEVKRLLGDNSWEYTDDSVNTVSGTSLHITDAQPNEHFISLIINGKTNQSGSGTPSPSNIRAITGVTKITVNGTDYALSQELFDIDNYNVTSGTGVAYKYKKVLNGGTWVKDSYSDGDYLCAYLTDSTIKSDSMLLCDKFQTGLYNSGALKEEIGIINGAFSICISTSRLASNDVSGLQSWLSSNPITVLYELDTPSTITGTAQSITTALDNTITTDNAGNVSANYINDSVVLYVKHPFSLQKIGLCNRFNYQVMSSDWTNNQEAITIYMNYMYLKVNKSVVTNLTNFNTWLNSTSVLYISPLLIPNVINVSPTIATYYNGTNHLTTDANGVIHVSLYNNISHNVFVNTSDYNEYMIPSLTTITCGTVGGNISVQNTDDVNSNQITFTGLLPNEIITIDEFGQMQSSTGLNRYDNWNGKRLHLISGDNHINISGDVVRLDISYQNVRRIGI